MKRAVIKADGTVEGTSVVLDDVDISENVVSVDISIGPDCRPVATIKGLVVEATAEGGNIQFYRVCANCSAQLAEPPAPPPKMTRAEWDALCERIWEARNPKEPSP